MVANEVASMSSPVRPSLREGSRPTAIVDEVHVRYQVLATGRRATSERRLLKRAPSLKRTREIHALKGVSLVAYEGDAIGVVGRNGSGKSTLLRVIAGLTPPSEGAVYAEGEPALLGVNAALINDLTGERNVTLGSLALGMTPSDVQERYDSIVEFAGIGDFIELPMRTYSAGMAARLRFAIAASTTHRILLIDEALATGDEDFRRRSEKRIADLRETAGTVFLVSHSLSVITETCNRAIWLEGGMVRLDGTAQEVVSAYKNSTR